MIKQLFIYLNDKSRSLYLRVAAATKVVDPELGLVRVVITVFMGLFYIPTFSWLAAVPDAFFNPPLLSLPAFFNAFPSPLFLRVLDLVLTLSIFCLALGVKSRWAGCIYALAFLIGSSFEFSLGAISHVFLLPAVLVCLSFSNWGVHFALVPDKPYRRFGALGLPLAAICIAFAFFTAGVLKLFVWMDFNLDTNGFLNWFYSGYFNFGRSRFLTGWVFDLPVWLLEFMDYTVIIFEISALFFLLKGRRHWNLWIITACFFHLGTTLLLNIHFIQHIPIYALFLMPQIFKSYSWNYSIKLIVFSLVALPFIWRLYLILNDAPRIFLFSESALVDQGAMLTVALISWIMLIIFGITGIFTEKKPFFE